MQCLLIMNFQVKIMVPFYTYMMELTPIDIKDLHDIIVDEWNKTIEKGMEPIGL